MSMTTNRAEIQGQPAAPPTTGSPGSPGRPAHRARINELTPTSKQHAKGTITYRAVC